MRRHEVYFLQSKRDGAWDTLERAQIVSVLVSSLERAFARDEAAELRLVAGDWDEEAGEWRYTQIFYVDRGAVDLAFGEPTDGGPADGGPADGGPAGIEPSDIGLEQRSERGAGSAFGGPDDGLEAGRSGLDMPAGGPFDAGAEDEGTADDFAAAIRRARGDAQDRIDDDAANDDPFAPAGRAEAEETDTLRDLGFARRREALDDEAEDRPVGPPPAFARSRRKGGGPLMMISILLLALMFVAIGGIALMVAFDRPEIRPYVRMVEDYLGGDSTTPAPPDGSDRVMPDTSGQVLSFQGVAPGLRGRWSPGDCEASYLEFDEDGYVIANGEQVSVEIPVTETILDDYTFFVRRSPILVEHYQRLGDAEIQLIGRTSRVGFETVTSDILTRCP